jgi:primosomal protein N' (replication factor Y)
MPVLPPCGAPPIEIAPDTPLVQVVLERAAPGTYSYLAGPELAEPWPLGARVRVPFGSRTASGYVVGRSTVGEASRAGVPIGRLKRVIERLDWRKEESPEAAPLVTPELLELARWVSRQYACPLGTAVAAVLPAELAPLSLGEAYARGVSDRKAARLKKDAPRPAVPDLVLTEAQEHALSAIREALATGAHRTFLLQGVTGSGKTEVYLRALATGLAQGKPGVVVVPEIALTPQTAQRFEERLGSRGVAVLHSHMSDGERAEAWRAIRAGRMGVVLGARSALFAPLPRLGCIVVDEEHEGTYKQEGAPRYHARELALQRARAAGAVLILGTATPSLEAAHAAQQGTFTLLKLPQRIHGRPLPPTQVVSMQDENRETKRYNYLSRALAEEIHNALGRGEQAILFLNRRGYATVITCLHCGHTARCTRCDIALTSHRARNVLRCHYCNRETPAPDRCPICGAPGVKFWGLGTERLENEVRERFPQAQLARMDSDTMRRRSAYVETLSAFRAGRIQLLLGTQMIAKGLDFPNVTLVGIVLADTALHLPDFRARERTYQLLEQVAGRAGRGEKGGRVVVQSYLPEDPAIRYAAAHDYDGFAAAELPGRRAYGYPPFTRLARVVVQGPKKEKVEPAARAAGDALRFETRGSAIQVLGPSVPPIAQLRGKHRFHLLVKAPDGELLAELLSGPAGRALRQLRGAQATVDVDPQNML